MSFVKMKDVLFNVLAIGTVLAALVVIFAKCKAAYKLMAVDNECHNYLTGQCRKISFTGDGL